MRGDEGFELAHEIGVAPVGEVELDPLLEAGEMQLLEAGDPVPGEAGLGELGQRCAAPERERFSRIAFLHKALAAREVELVIVERDEIAGRLRLHAVLAERFPQLRDVDLKRLLRRRRALLLPERVEQAVGGNDVVRVQQEHREQRPVLGASQSDDLPPVGHGEWAEDPELHRSATVPPCFEPFPLRTWPGLTGT